MNTTLSNVQFRYLINSINERRLQYRLLMKIYVQGSMETYTEWLDVPEILESDAVDEIQ